MHNYAIVDEVDSVLIDDARTPLIISGPTPKGDDQMFEQFQPKVEELVKMQRNLVTKLLAEAKIKIASDDKKTREEGAVLLYRCFKGLPKNGALIKYLSDRVLNLCCSKPRLSIWQITTVVCLRLRTTSIL